MKLPVDVGASPNDNSGDPIRDSFIKINSNEDELYEGANITATAPIAKTTVADTSVTISLANGGVIQTLTLNGAHTGTFINFKIGQVVDIILTGNHVLTFDATASGTPEINKVGTVSYDGTTTQIIQVQCASDNSTTPIFYYACNTYASDTTP